MWGKAVLRRDLIEGDISKKSHFAYPLNRGKILFP